MDKIIDLIKENDIITIFRHEFADPDALGSQFGLKEIILSNFPNKEVYVLGKEVEGLSNNLFENSDEVSDEIIEKSLAIVLDTANYARIDDQRYQKAHYIIKIDHHPSVDDYGHYNFIDTSSCATCYLISDIAFSKSLEVNDKAATYLYAGIIGDTNRFFHNNTDENVFKMATKLVQANADIQRVYQVMYSRKIEDLRLNALILDSFKIEDNRLAYYVLEEKDYLSCGIPFEKAKENVNILAGIEGIDIWASCTYNPDTKHYHVSLRSKSIVVNDVAQAFGGGGHVYAAGVKVSTIERFYLIINALKKKL